MRRVLLTVVVASVCGAAARAQEAPKLQWHGFATQSVLDSNQNNYLGMDTSEASAGWTEAAFNVNSSPSDKVRIGAQLHMTKLGKFTDYVAVDWALVDVKIEPGFSVRAGKVKIPWGLYNDQQDADPGYLWALLPEPIYAVDWRATNLSQWGAEVYGKKRLGARFGELAYSVYGGYYFYDTNDGYMEGFRQQGLEFAKPPSGITPGVHVRWKTPERGLTVGTSLMAYNAHGDLPGATFHQPIAYWPAYFAQYDRGKVFASAQYVTLVQKNDVTTGDLLDRSVTDNHSWFVMGGYRITDRLQAGAYYTRNTLVSAEDPADSTNYFHDWTVSGRYDFNPYFYLKLEEHFIDGSGLGFYTFNNESGVRPSTRLLVAKIGYTF